MADGWQFQRGKYLVLVGEPNLERAKVIAIDHFGGEPDLAPKEIPRVVLDFLGITAGGKANAGVFQSWTA